MNSRRCLEIDGINYIIEPQNIEYYKGNLGALYADSSEVNLYTSYVYVFFT